MAAAVYLHNALFGQPSRTSTDNFTSNNDEDSDEDADGISSDDIEGDTTGAQLGSSRAPSSSSPMSTSRARQPNADTFTVDEHGRKLSVSSQSTLVPVSPLPWAQAHTRPTRHSLSAPLEPIMSDPLSTHVEQTNEPPSTQEQVVPPSSSPLPPGLPATTHRTSSRRPLTPYPFPPLSPSELAPATTATPRSRSHSHTRRRPKGRRRGEQEEEEEERRPSTFRRVRRPYTPPHLRQGRIPNISLTRRTRLTILAVRFILSLVLCGWSAYSCAKYWLAYSEFHPTNNNTVEDPPRSQYAFVLALTCTLATALLVLDSAWFMYFVLYPHDGRLLSRIPTIAPISRISNPTEEPAVNDATDDTDGSPQPQPRSRIPVQLRDDENDRFTAMPYRNSGFSATSSYRRSRRLSKPRPESWASAAAVAAVYPPDQELAGEEPVADQPVQEGQPLSLQENTPSRFVVEPTRAPGDESDPQVEKRTYRLHLPALCHEPSISPLPFPPLAPAQARALDKSTRRRRKWRRTRVFLHVIHWLAFIAINIPGFVNVALIPVWYEPSATVDPANNGSNVNTGINSPHRLAGLCTWSPDAIWAGIALPPSHPPPCASTVSYKAWLWGAIGRVLVTFLFAGLWVIFDGLWWGAWVVGTRHIGWKGAIGRPWMPRRAPKAQQQQQQEQHPQETEDDSEGPRGEVKETPWAKRIRLLSGASKASAKSGKSGKSQKEKVGELVIPTVPSPPPANAAIGAAAIGVAGGITSFGVDPHDALSSSAPKHKVRRKPVSTQEVYSLNSPPLTKAYFEQPKMPGGGIGSRRPSAQESIGGSTVVGSPAGATFLPSSPIFTPASPPASFSDHANFGNTGRRSMALDIVPELESRSSDEREADARSSPEMERRYPDRPQSRLARYDDDRYQPNDPSPPSPESPRYPPSPTRVGWSTDLNNFSPITSPTTGDPLLSRGYFMVGDGGFSAGNSNDGAYDEDSYYRAVSGEEQRSSNANRGTSPNSERSNSPNSYGHGVEVQVETPTTGGDDDDSPGLPRLIPASQGQWSQPSGYQHPLAMGIQMAMGQPPEFEREVRMLGSVVRRMSTIESLGSHERELSRRGSAATARTTQTGRGNSAGTAQREGTNGSGNSGPLSPLLMTNGSGSGGQTERTDAEPITDVVRANSPVDMTPP